MNNNLNYTCEFNKNVTATNKRLGQKYPQSYIYNNSNDRANLDYSLKTEEIISCSKPVDKYTDSQKGIFLNSPRKINTLLKPSGIDYTNICNINQDINKNLNKRESSQVEDLNPIIKHRRIEQPTLLGKNIKINYELRIKNRMELFYEFTNSINVKRVPDTIIRKFYKDFTLNIYKNEHLEDNLIIFLKIRRKLNIYDLYSYREKLRYFHPRSTTRCYEFSNDIDKADRTLKFVLPSTNRISRYTCIKKYDLSNLFKRGINFTSHIKGLEGIKHLIDTILETRIDNNKVMYQVLVYKDKIEILQHHIDDFNSFYRNFTQDSHYNVLSIEQIDKKYIGKVKETIVSYINGYLAALESYYY